MQVQRSDRKPYEPDTLTSIQRSIDKHLNKELNKLFSIIRDIEFAKSRESIRAARKYASESLTDIEIETIWERKALGDHTPLNLQLTIWFLIWG